MDLKRLRYFLAVAELGSFTKAAARLNMAQPPLNKRIQELEAEIDALLFNRMDRPLTLTDAGRLLRRHAKKVVRSTDDLTRALEELRHPSRARLKVGIVPSGFHTRLPQLVRRFEQLAPHLDLSLVELNGLEQIEALKDGRIDVGISRVRADDPDIVLEIVRYEPMLAAIPRGGKLASMAEPLDLEMLAHETNLIYPASPRPRLADHILSLYRDRGLTPVRIVELQEMQTALVMVAAGNGVCIVPDAARGLQHPDLAFRTMTGSPTVPITLFRRAGTMTSEVAIFREALQQLVAEWND
jgi:DNA-binding transcriptional LysR family regulator